MEKEWLTRVYKENGGNLFKCAWPADLVYHGPDQQTYKNLENGTVTGGRVYELQTNKSQDDYASLVGLITMLDHPTVGTFPSDIASILNVDHYLKALALDVATGNWDDYAYNKNNFYLYDNPSDSTYDFITYDPDNTFGVDWEGTDWAIRDCRNWVNTNMQLPLAQKLLAVPVFFNRYKLFLDTIANTVIHPDSVFPHIDAYKALIQQAAVADTYRTLDYGYTVADFNNAFIKAIDLHTPYGLKPFLVKRKQSILNQLYPSGIKDNATQNRNLVVFPNPAGESISFSLADPSVQVISAQILDLSGKVQLEFDNLHGMAILPVQSLMLGMYLLRVSSPDVVFQAKFIKK